MDVIFENFKPSSSDKTSKFIFVVNPKHKLTNHRFSKYAKTIKIKESLFYQIKNLSIDFPHPGLTEHTFLLSKDDIIETIVQTLQQSLLRNEWNDSKINNLSSISSIIRDLTPLRVCLNLQSKGQCIFLGDYQSSSNAHFPNRSKSI